MKPPVLLPPIVRKRSARISVDSVKNATNMNELRAIVARLDEESALETLKSIIDAPSEEHVLPDGKTVNVNGTVLYLLRQASEIRLAWIADAQKTGKTPEEIAATLTPLTTGLNAAIVERSRELREIVTRDANKEIVGYKQSPFFLPKFTDSDKIGELARELNLPDAPAITPSKRGKTKWKAVDTGLMNALAEFLTPDPE